MDHITPHKEPGTRVCVWEGGARYLLEHEGEGGRGATGPALKEGVQPVEGRGR